MDPRDEVQLDVVCCLAARLLPPSSNIVVYATEIDGAGQIAQQPDLYSRFALPVVLAMLPQSGPQEPRDTSATWRNGPGLV